jgi:uncharacterized membrane protein YphA (DoxX/SURF4 family)
LQEIQLGILIERALVFFRMISLAKDTVTPKFGRNTIYTYRVVLAAVWLFWGIKSGFMERSLAESSHGLSLASSLGVAPQLLSFIVGALLILIGLWLIAGSAFQGCGVFQLVMVLFLWWLKYEPGEFLNHSVGQLPMICLILTVIGSGPGSHVWAVKGKSRSTWTRG